MLQFQDDPELITAKGLPGILERVKKNLTCGCSKVTVRVIKFCISLWMIADIISDAINTKHYLDYARVIIFVWYPLTITTKRL